MDGIINRLVLQHRKAENEKGSRIKNTNIQKYEILIYPEERRMKTKQKQHMQRELLKFLKFLKNSNIVLNKIKQ